MKSVGLITILITTRTTLLSEENFIYNDYTSDDPTTTACF